jgi:predicted deacylase
MSGQSTGWTDIDLDGDGKRSGWIYVPNSVNGNAWGCVRVPIGVVKNGPGPTVLLMGGNHGDEYEGQVGLAKLYRALDAADICGRILFLPNANYPACEAGERVSPLDDGNLNRAFPGNATGSITERITHFINHELFARSQWFVDIHAAGKGDDFVPVIGAFLGDNEQNNQAAIEGAKILGMPYYSEVKVVAARSSFASSCAVGRGVISIGGEFGGRGSLGDFGLKIIEEGLPRVLRHIGVLSKSVAVVPLNTQSQRLVPVPTSQYPYAPCSGIFESVVRLGDSVRAGDVCGRIHSIENLSVEPVEITFKTDGMVVFLRHSRRVQPGVCLAGLSRQEVA